MTEFSDELLSQFLDGEADAATTRRIESAIARDPSLAERVAALAQGDALLRDAFDAALGETPARLLAATRAPVEAAGSVVAFRRRAARAAQPHLRLMAASVAALAIGAASSTLWTGRSPGLVADSGGQLVAGPQLNAALVRARSGEPAPLKDGALTVVLSFRAADGRLCRQFSLTEDNRGAQGVACREADGWRIEGWSAARPAPRSGYVSAGADDAVSAIVDRLGVGETLDQEAERRAIAGGWKRVP